VTAAALEKAANPFTHFTNVWHSQYYIWKTTDARGYIPDFPYIKLSHHDYKKILYLTCNSPPRPVNRLYRKLCPSKLCIRL